jgi:hypothetical protein
MYRKTWFYTTKLFISAKHVPKLEISHCRKNKFFCNSGLNRHPWSLKIGISGWNFTKIIILWKQSHFINQKIASWSWSERSGKRQLVISSHQMDKMTPLTLFPGVNGSSLVHRQHLSQWIRLFVFDCCTIGSRPCQIPIIQSEDQFPFYAARNLQ